MVVSAIELWTDDPMPEVLWVMRWSIVVCRSE